MWKLVVVMVFISMANLIMRVIYLPIKCFFSAVKVDQISTLIVASCILCAGASCSKNNNEKATIDLNDVVSAFEMRKWRVEIPSDTGENDLLTLVSVSYDGSVEHIWAEQAIDLSRDYLELIIWKSPRGEGYSYLVNGRGQTHGQVNYPFSFFAMRFAEAGSTLRFGDFLLKSSESGRVSEGMKELQEGESGIRIGAEKEGERREPKKGQTQNIKITNP